MTNPLKYVTALLNLTETLLLTGYEIEDRRKLDILAGLLHAGSMLSHIDELQSAHENDINGGQDPLDIFRKFINGIDPTSHE